MINCKIPLWHIAFVLVTAGFVFLALRDRLNDKIEILDVNNEKENLFEIDENYGSENDLDMGQIYEDDDNDLQMRVRRDSEIETEHFFEIDLNHLYFMRNYLNKTQIEKILNKKKKKDYAKLGGDTPGELYATTFNNHEVNFTRLDRNTLNRIEMEIVVDNMQDSVPQLFSIIERLIIFEGEVNDAKSRSGGELRRERLNNAYHMCLLERNIICNTHLPLRFQCTCHVVPHLRHELEAPLCDELYRIKNIEKLVLSYAMMFPVPQIMSVLADAFLTQFLTYYTEFVKRADRLIVLRRNCINQKLFLYQIALLKESDSMSEGQLPRLPLFDSNFEEFHVERLRNERASLAQPLLHYVPFRQFSSLMPIDVRKTSWYRETIARLPNRDCAAQTQWDYEQFLECRPQEFWFIVLSALAIGTILGVLRLYHFFEGRRERFVQATLLNTQKR